MKTTPPTVKLSAPCTPTHQPAKATSSHHFACSRKGNTSSLFSCSSYLVLLRARHWVASSAVFHPSFATQQIFMAPGCTVPLTSASLYNTLANIHATGYSTIHASNPEPFLPPCRSSTWLSFIAQAPSFLFHSTIAQFCWPQQFLLLTHQLQNLPQYPLTFGNKSLLQSKYFTAHKRYICSYLVGFSLHTRNF